MKPEKYQALFEEVEEWLAGEYFKSFHRVFLMIVSELSLTSKRSI